jgi:hypothetical protein
VKLAWRRGLTEVHYISAATSLVFPPRLSDSRVYTEEAGASADALRAGLGSGRRAFATSSGGCMANTDPQLAVDRQPTGAGTLVELEMPMTATPVEEPTIGLPCDRATSRGRR